jgi:hypothetical protein
MRAKAAAPELVVLYAEKEPIEFERAALRWLARYVTEAKAGSPGLHSRLLSVVGLVSLFSACPSGFWPFGPNIGYSNVISRYRALVR